MALAVERGLEHELHMALGVELALELDEGRELALVVALLPCGLQELARGA